MGPAPAVSLLLLLVPQAAVNIAADTAIAPETASFAARSLLLSERIGPRVAV
jgi:hypothetical protein